MTTTIGTTTDLLLHDPAQATAHKAIESARRLRDLDDPATALQAVADLTALAVEGIVAQHPEILDANGRPDPVALRRLWNRYEP